MSRRRAVEWPEAKCNSMKLEGSLTLSQLQAGLEAGGISDGGHRLEDTMTRISGAGSWPAT
jgi:hypothetical protein